MKKTVTCALVAALAITCFTSPVSADECPDLAGVYAFCESENGERGDGLEVIQSVVDSVTHYKFVPLKEGDPESVLIADGVPRSEKEDLEGAELTTVHTSTCEKKTLHHVAAVDMMGTEFVTRSVYFKTSNGDLGMEVDAQFMTLKQTCRR